MGADGERLWLGCPLVHEVIQGKSSRITAPVAVQHDDEIVGLKIEAKRGPASSLRFLLSILAPLNAGLRTIVTTV